MYRLNICKHFGETNSGFGAIKEESLVLKPSCRPSIAQKLVNANRQRLLQSIVTDKALTNLRQYLCSYIGLLILFTLTPNVVFAKTSFIDIVEKNGKHIYVPMREHPQITTDNDTVIVTSSSSILSLNIDELLNIEFVDDTPYVGIDNTLQDRKIEFDSEFIYIEGVVNDIVNIYNINGTLVKSYRLDRTFLIIDVSGLSNGQYIISTKNINCKFLKR